MSRLERIPWLMPMIHPRKAMHALMAQDRPGFSVLPLLIGGVLLLQWWADTWGIAGRYETGQVLSVSLVLGPLLVLGFALVVALMFSFGGKRLLGNAHPADFGRHFVLLLNAAGPCIALALVSLLELVLVPEGPFAPGGGIWWSLKTLCVAWFAALSWMAWDAAALGSRWRKILGFSLGWLGGLLVCLGLCFLLGLPIF